MKTKFLIPVILFCFVQLCAFQYSGSSPQKGYADTMKLVQPANFPPALYNLKITNNGFALGKTLFYDPNLSVNGSVSCASCHQASAAFANLNRAVSTGVNDCKGERNAPPLFNMAWQKNYMWDGRLSDMTKVPVNALTNPCEMGTTMVAVVHELQQSPNYPDLFKKAFGDKHITEDKILDALTQFTAMMVSANTKYDRVIRKENNTAFNEQEAAGYALFKKNCSSCHTEPLFTDQTYRNNGLDIRSADIGRDSLTHSPKDAGKFRVPSLRNIEITGPYMHDGRFYSLKEVLAHYASGVKPHVNLDKLLNQDGKPGITLTIAEQGQIIAFLKTLTDVDFINDRRFNNH